MFTCLTIRATDIEIAHSLDTDSFINSLWRFIARRVKPLIMGPISSVVRKKCAPVFTSRSDRVFMNICCYIKVVEV